MAKLFTLTWCGGFSSSLSEEPMRNLPAGKPTISSVTPLGRFSVNRVSFAGGGDGEEGGGGDTLGRGVGVTGAIGNCVDVTVETHATRKPRPM